MPKKGKKGKGGKKGKKGKKAKIVTPFDAFSREALLVQLADLLTEVAAEQKDRNLTQIERDRLRDFLAVTRGELDALKEEVLNLHAAAEDAESKHRLEIKMYQQKVKYLMHEQRMNLDAARAEGVAALQLLEAEFGRTEADMRRNQRRLKDELKEQQRQHEDLVKNFKLLQAQAESTLRAELEQRAAAIEARYQDKLKRQLEEQELRRKTELHEVEERKNTQLSEMIRNHEQAFHEMQSYYNDITTNNLALVNALKETMEEMKVTQMRNAELLKRTKAENRAMRLPLASAGNQLEGMKRKLADHERMRQMFDNTKVMLRRTEAQLQHVLLEREVMGQRLDAAQHDRDMVYKRFLSAVHEVQQKSAYKELLAEKKLSMLREELAVKDSETADLIEAHRLDPCTMAQIFCRLEQVVGAKNELIADLQCEVARVCKAHADLRAALESRLKPFGIPLDDVGFEPLEVGARTDQARRLGLGPAGLVSTRPF